MSDPTLQLIAGLIVIVLLFGTVLAYLSMRGNRTRQRMLDIEERARPRLANPRRPESKVPRAGSGLATTAFGGSLRTPRLAAIAKVDPNFSELDFLEAAAALFAWAHKHRPRRDYLTLNSFLAEPAVETFLSGIADLDSVQDIRVGEVRATRVYIDAEWTSVELSLRSVQIERIKDEFQEVWRVENWRLRRRSDVRSPSRETLIALGCPFCDSRGIPDEKGHCPDCRRLRCGPTAHWQVAAIGDVRRNPYPPQPSHLPLGPAGPPTPAAEDLDQRTIAFNERNPDIDAKTLREGAVAALRLALSPEGVDLEGPLGRRLRYEAEQLAETHVIRHLVLGEIGEINAKDFNVDATHEIVDLSVQLTMRAWIEEERSSVPTEPLPYVCELSLARSKAGTWLPIDLRWVEALAGEG